MRSRRPSECSGTFAARSLRFSDRISRTFALCHAFAIGRAVHMYDNREDVAKSQFVSISAGKLPCIQCCMTFISSPDDMLPLRSVMIQSEPTTTRNTMSTPNASARTLLVLSGAVVMCRKKTR